MDAVPTGLRMNCLFRQPHASIPRNKGRFLGTPVKRGANNRCAYGAGAGPVSYTHLYAQRLEELLQKPYLSSDEQLEEVRLKKLKLHAKDLIFALERRSPAIA